MSAPKKSNKKEVLKTLKKIPKQVPTPYFEDINGVLYVGDGILRDVPDKACNATIDSFLNLVGGDEDGAVIKEKFNKMQIEIDKIEKAPVPRRAIDWKNRLDSDSQSG